MKILITGGNGMLAKEVEEKFAPGNEITVTDVAELDITDEKAVYKALSRTMLKPISEIVPYVEFGKSKVTQLLKEMDKKGVIKIEGKGRGTKYIRK